MKFWVSTWKGNEPHVVKDGIYNVDRGGASGRPGHGHHGDVRRHR